MAGGRSACPKPPCSMLRAWRAYSRARRAMSGDWRIPAGCRVPCGSAHWCAGGGLTSTPGSPTAAQHLGEGVADERRWRAEPARCCAALCKMRPAGLAEREPLTEAGAHVIISTMRKREKQTRPTMTELLRQALGEAGSLRAVERATGVKRQSLMKFVRGAQSLRLDKADVLAAYFRIAAKREGR